MRTRITCEQSLYDSLCACGYSLQPKDLPAAARVMAAAFGNDASIRYLLGGEGEGSADWTYFLCMLKAVWGKCVMLSADEGLHDLLILFPPQLRAVPTLGFLRHGGLRLCRSFGPGLFWRSLRYEGNCQRVKSELAPPGSWYCMCFVVAPPLQGQGRGSRLMRPALEVLERGGVPLYLETHKAGNVSLYTHLGFKQAGTTAIPGTEIKQYAMTKA